MKCTSFKPLAHKDSRILILGTMPGPEALRRREYYGFPGNHFWKIMGSLFENSGLESYSRKKELLRREKIALWDVIGVCERVGASDSTIKNVRPNDITSLIKRCPNIRTIFLNGKKAENYYRKHFGSVIQIASFTLPSTSPAHAAMSLDQKRAEWSVIKKFLTTRNPWC